jgi:hypothetical protein
VFVVVTVDAQQLPVAAVRRIIVVVMILVMYGQLLEIDAIKFACATPAHPRIKFERLLPVTLLALLSIAPGLGDDSIQLARIGCFAC